jgi:hypothetical protein
MAKGKRTMTSKMMTGKTMVVALLIVATGALTACQKKPEADAVDGSAAPSDMSSAPMDSGASTATPDTPGLTPPPGDGSSSSPSSMPPTGASSPTSRIEREPDRPVTRLASA